MSSTYDCRNCFLDTRIIDNVTLFSSEANVGDLIDFLEKDASRIATDKQRRLPSAMTIKSMLAMIITISQQDQKLSL